MTHEPEEYIFENKSVELPLITFAMYFDAQALIKVCSANASALV